VCSMEKPKGFDTLWSEDKEQSRARSSQIRALLKVSGVCELAPASSLRKTKGAKTKNRLARSFKFGPLPLGKLVSSFSTSR